MIVYFPEIYPDELVYSVLARYYAKSGYMSYMFVTQEIYKRKLQKPNIEFINLLNPEIVGLMTREMTMEELIEKHTMFPYYGRFMKPEKRKKMFDKLVNMKTSDSSNLGLPRGKNRLERYLRYCPVCVKEDRQKYGETYWHREHQISGLSVCPKHGCVLNYSDVLMNRNNTTVLISAESIDMEVEIIVKSESKFEKDFSNYLAAVFQNKVNMSDDTNVGRTLQNKICKSKYMLENGSRNLALLFSDFTEWYQREEKCFAERWQMEKVLTNDRFNFYEVCAIGMFVGITVADLVKL